MSFHTVTECSEVFQLLYFYGGESVVWTIFFLWWYIQVSCSKRPYARPLHRLISFVLLFKSLLDIFQTLFIATCPMESAYADYLRLAVGSCFTLFYTFLFTCLLLMSKGYCVTRYALYRQEVTVVAVLMGAVYLSYSAYTLDPSGLYPLLFLVMGLVLFITGKYSLDTLKAVRIQVLNLVAANVQEMISPARLKLRMMSNFTRLLFTYFILQLLLYITIVPASLISFELNFANIVVKESCEFLLLFWIFLLFRPRDLGLYGTIAIVDTSDPLQVHRIPPLLSAKLPEERLEDLSKLDENMPILILSPTEFDPERPFAGAEIGQLMSQPMAQARVQASMTDLRIN